MPRRTGAIPLVVTTHDGRPTKIDGNPLHPASGGATDTFAQASILDLYDPTRSRRFLHKGKPSERVEFEKYLANLRAKFAATGVACHRQKTPSIASTSWKTAIHLPARWPITGCVVQPARFLRLHICWPGKFSRRPRRRR